MLTNKPGEIRLLKSHGEYVGVDGVAHIYTYRSTHKNHPCAIWARSHQDHYFWLRDLFNALLAEYSARYDKSHISTRLYDIFVHAPHKLLMPGVPHVTPVSWAYAMPERMHDLPITDAYRYYFNTVKQRMARWYRGNYTPDWFIPEEIK
jgi:hypothetical protein